MDSLKERVLRYRRSGVVVRWQDCKLGHLKSQPTLLQNTGVTWNVSLFLSVSAKQNKMYVPCPGPEGHT